MKMKWMLALALTSMLAACGSMEATPSQGIADDDDYVTGSNLAHRDKASKVKTMTPEQAEEMRRGITQQRAGGGGG